MSQHSSAELYTQAATELEQATKHLREAAEHMQAGQREHASQHAFISHGHILTAQDNTRHAAKLEAEEHSAAVMSAHPPQDS